MTERQKKSWPDRIASLSASVPEASVPEHPRNWDITYDEETRPGRGHYINATYNDGEHFAQILMDVYGGGSESIAELTWRHSSHDEECECDPCTDQRAEDDEPFWTCPSCGKESEDGLPETHLCWGA